ncbi:MAG: hypothetical protein HXX11_10385 [Desulfuromonadales bacterium]|nr:hypothetical protein [Desulfuromonadales bacterium]
MNTKKLSAGDIIEARCTRCRDILNHRIVAMVAEKVVRVECNTCGGVHNYYPPPSLKPVKTPGGSATTRKSTATPRAPKRDPQQSERDEWLSLRANMRLDRAIVYDMGGKFRADDLVDHPSFGLGVVKLIVPPSKMQVLFEDGIKLLRCK